MSNRNAKALLTFTCLLLVFIGVAKTFQINPSTNKTESDPSNIIWGNSVTNVDLNGDSITVNSTRALIEDCKVTIKYAGTYWISGTLNDGQIIVDTDDEKDVILVLSGVDIVCTTNAPINVVNAKKVIIILERDTKNYVKDGSYYVLESGEDEPNAVIFSKSDLAIAGDGSLNIDGNFNDGIASKDGLIIENGYITVTSVDDGIRGKDYIIIENGELTLDVGGDGLKSDNDEDETKGYITIESGAINIISGGDAIQAVTDIRIIDGEINIISGGGSNSRIYEDISAKGIKADTSVIINGGTITANSADDAIHSNSKITINGGVFILSTGDDAIHADSSLIVNGGDITITQSYEGLESAGLTINSGNIHITSSDDGLNAAGGRDSSGLMGKPGREPFSSGNYYLKINGGYIWINAAGDGIDINGPVDMTGGTLIINGPTSNMNGALDYDQSFKITGGYLLAVGSSGMAQSPDTSSTQFSFLLNLRQSVKASNLIHVQTSDGDEVFTFKTIKNYQSILFSSPDLEKGTTYEVYLGGSSNGIVDDGIYQGGTYTSGTKYTSITISGIVTKISSR